MAPVPLLLIATLAAVAPLPWRRSHPLSAVLVAFGTLIVVDLFRMATGTQGALTSSVSATLVLTYALFRWGSGRDAVRGLLVILTWLAITFIADVTTLADTITGYAFFFFAAARDDRGAFVGFRFGHARYGRHRIGARAGRGQGWRHRHDHIVQAPPMNEFIPPGTRHIDLPSPFQMKRLPRRRKPSSNYQSAQSKIASGSSTIFAASRLTNASSSALPK